ncbi:MAG TPA: L,D-transpeptidase family protein [Usitatibacter sp.]|nr:L,D-transpeptidase family protein [Usitatibacter sp.]
MRRQGLLRSASRNAGRIVLVAFAAGATALADGSLAPAGSGPAFANDAEGALVRAIVEMREAGLKRALAEINRAIADRPNFRLAQLVKGDILMAQAGHPVAFAGNFAPAATLAPLQEEARARLQRYLDAPPVDDLPSAVVQLAPNQPYALVVDTSRSRLYVYANEAGRPRYVTDFYISLGKDGVDKEREGDQKTPIGVYTIVADKMKLPDFYGPRAFPISYPNDWDRMHGRQGHGIWLHGTPSATYSRPPWATDGCVVLANDDLARLSKYVDVTRTPVVIGQSITWRDPKRWQAERDQFVAAFTRWRKDWESLDDDRYFSHYSARFRSDTHDLAAWKARKRQVNAGKKWVKVGIEDLSLFAYPGVPGMVMATFEQDYRSSNMSNRRLKRQYWIREGGEWRILHESVVS